MAAAALYEEQEQEEEQEHRFFDAVESISEVDEVSCSSRSSIGEMGTNDFQYDVWSTAPKSVHQRKNTFLRFMGLSSEEQQGFEDEENDDVLRTETAVVKGQDCLVNRCDSCSRSLRIQSLEDGGGKFSEIVSAPLVQKFVDRHVKVADKMSRTVSKVKGQLLGSLRSTARNLVQKRCKPAGLQSRCIELSNWAKVQRVKVHQSKKRLKELSAVFIGQDIQAHKGSILTMKFSLDGRYLASAGEDAVVRVWQVVEDERSNEIDIPDVDPSCLYFTVNNFSELAPLMAEKQKISMLKSLKRTKSSACVIFPPKVFRILEKPVHEFYGHRGDVLDLSWSKDNVSKILLIDQFD